MKTRTHTHIEDNTETVQGGEMMNAQNVIDQLKGITTLGQLFTLWRKKHREEQLQSFIIDGIVNDREWKGESLKVCFLLKESYINPKEYEKDMLRPDHNLKKRHWNAYINKEDGIYVYDMATHMREHAPWYMWCRVAAWMSKLFKLLGIETENPLQKIAVVNIKKSEGKSSSDYGDIMNYAREDRELIRKELELIDPDLIICGATYDYCVEEGIFDDLKELGTLKNFKNRKVACAGRRVIFDCYHPSASISYDKIESFFKEALQCVDLERLTNRQAMTKNQVCLFFYVNGEFLVHGCSLEAAECYGDFLIYPDSHFEIWEKHYAKRYGVDFDYFPRGRVAYRKTEGAYQILYDRCIEAQVRQWAASAYDAPVTFGLDEHYQCRRCNRHYAM